MRKVFLVISGSTTFLPTAAGQSPRRRQPPSYFLSSRFIPHLGHLPGLSETTSGCMGQAYACTMSLWFSDFDDFSPDMTVSGGYCASSAFMMPSSFLRLASVAA